MKAALRNAWGSLAPGRRAAIAVLAMVLGVASYLWLLHAADRARGQLGTSVAALRTQAVLLEQQAAEHARLRSAPPVPSSSGELRALVQARTDAARLGALARIEPLDPDHVRVAFGAVSFADWLGWTADLQAQHVRLDGARIEALAAPGLVSVSATFARNGPQ
ncbi:MAG: type II secretion system protein GspM [Burkholderiales bacterium]